MEPKPRFFYRVELFGEIEAVNEEQARMIVENGFSTNLRLQANETQDYNIMISDRPLVDEEDDEGTPQ